MINVVETWLKNFEVDLNRNPAVVELYEKLIYEELAELKAETEQGESELKECADLLWVTLGLLLAKGYTAVQLEQALNLVAVSNFSKLSTEQEAKAFVEANPGTSYKVNEYGRCIILNANGKIQKGPNYEQAKLSSIFRLG